MKVLRFTGRIEGEYIDVRLTTDMINTTDNFFNITQIQEGQEFSTTDKQGGYYRDYLSATFKETNNTLGTAITFAMDNDLDLRIYDGDGSNETFLVNDASASAS